MTLISAFKCSAGFVLHADSEENCGGFRRSVQKLTPQTMGNLDVIVGGSGIGGLIDGFTVKLKQHADNNQISELGPFKQLVEKRLAPFYSNDVAVYPTEDINKVHKFIIAARCRATGTFEVWGSRHTTLIPVTAYELAGIEDDLYDRVAKQLYRDGMSFAQAMMAGVYLLSVAESTSSFIRGPIQVAAVWERGIELENPENVSAAKNRLEQYELEKKVNAILLACADTSISVPRFDQVLMDFANSLSSMHRNHIDEQAHGTDSSYLARTNPIRLLPEAIGFGSGGKFAVIHDAQQIAAQDAFIRKMITDLEPEILQLKRATERALAAKSKGFTQSVSQTSGSEP